MKSTLKTAGVWIGCATIGDIAFLLHFACQPKRPISKTRKVYHLNLPSFKSKAFCLHREPLHTPAAQALHWSGEASCLYPSNLDNNPHARIFTT
jgi:hypothetical protein